MWQFRPDPFTAASIAETKARAFDIPEGEPDRRLLRRVLGLRWGPFFLAEFIEIVVHLGGDHHRVLRRLAGLLLDADGFRIGGYTAEVVRNDGTIACRPAPVLHRPTGWCARSSAPSACKVIVVVLVPAAGALDPAAAFRADQLANLAGSYCCRSRSAGP
jgi:hypothetical protein